MRRTWLVLTMLAAASGLAAQTSVSPQLELRPMAGAYIPVGTHRDAMNDAAVYGGQLALQVRPAFHVLGTFAWSPAMNRYAGMALHDTNVYAYDLGVEFNMIRPLGAGWELKPFVGVGAGARTYDFRQPGLTSHTCASAYGALGTEFQYGFTALRLEARNYAYCFRDPVRQQWTNRDDIGLTAGVAFHFQPFFWR